MTSLGRSRPIGNALRSTGPKTEMGNTGRGVTAIIPSGLSTRLANMSLMVYIV
jgi:hypothetical protein